MLERNGVRARARLDVHKALSGGQVTTTKSARTREPELFGPVARDLLELYQARGRPPLRELVFVGPRGAMLSRHNWRVDQWKTALVKAWPCSACRGRGETSNKQTCPTCDGEGTTSYFRPYDLRHTCATLLIYAGWTVNEVAEHLGHEDPGFTARTYAHVLRDARHRRGVSIEDAIAQARSALAARTVARA